MCRNNYSWVITSASHALCCALYWFSSQWRLPKVTESETTSESNGRKHDDELVYIWYAQKKKNLLDDSEFGFNTRTYYVDFAQVLMKPHKYIFMYSFG